MHLRLCNVLNGHRNVELPHQNLLIVRSGRELSAIVEEGDGVDGTEVVVVLLYHSACPVIPL